MTGLGTALQVGSAFVSPGLNMTKPIQALQQGGRLARIAGQAIPAMAEAGTSMAGSALGGGTSADIQAAGIVPIAMRVVGMPVSRALGRATAESVMPDQVRNAVAQNLEKQFGPAVFPKRLWEEYVNPNQDMFIPSEQTTAFLKKMDLPSSVTMTNARLQRDLTNTIKKYVSPDTMRGGTMTLPGMGPGAYGMPQDMRTLGNMYDDMNKIDMFATQARREGLNYYAKQLYQLKDSMLDDMVKAVPKLADARQATWKQGNVSRLWDVMRSGKPIDDWREAVKEPWVNKAFNKSEVEDITKTMDQMARLGGGEHWVGRILGHAAFGAIGGAIGAATGGPWASIIGGGGGVLMPHILGQMMANAGGRAYLRGLMSKNPAGMTAATANAITQWFLAAQRTGSLQDFGGAATKFDLGVPELKSGQ